MLTRILGSVLASALLLGCVSTPASSEPHERPATDERDPVPTEPAGPTVIVEADAPAPEPVDADLPDCPSEASMPVYCTDAGKLAGAWTMADMVHIPSDALVVFEAEGTSQDRPSLVVAQLGETLYLRHITCGACARTMGYGFSGRPSAMTEAQLLDLQVALGLPAELPPLTRLTTWANYCAGENGRAALTEIAQQGRGDTPAPGSARD
jgi:hypothetical protein